MIQPLDLVDAGVWDVTLAGKKAVHPEESEVKRILRFKPEYLLSEPMVHKDLGWPFGCGICLRRGHHFMECGGKGLPAVVKRDGLQDSIVTLRSLFKDGWAKADGTKA